MNPTVPITVLTTTVDSEAIAHTLAQTAVQQRLAVCVQVEVIQSHYVWDGQMQSSAEWRLVCKTTPARAHALEQWLHSAHPYDVPQLLVRQEQASQAYATWVAEQVKT